MEDYKFLPEGYRFLIIGEAIKKGDYFWSDIKNKWLKIVHPGDSSNWIIEHVIRRDKQDGVD